MPEVASLSDFNRSQTDIISHLAETGEPLYLTRNGKAAVVVMDAEAFDRSQAAQEELRAREMETYAGLLRDYQDVLEGRTTSLGYADARIRAAKGW